MKTIVVVKAGWPLPLRLLAYRTYAALGWRVVVVDRLLNPSLRLADVPVSTDLSRPRNAALLVRERAGSVDGIVTFNDSGLIAAAELAEALGLPFLSSEVARRAVDKIEQRKAFAAAGLEIPEWRALESPDDAADTVAAWGDAIVKPADRAAGAAVCHATSVDEAVAAYAAAKRESPTGRVLAERFVEGPEVSVESMAVDGVQSVICATWKTITHGPAFVELGHSLPFDLGRDERRVFRLARTAAQALGLERGACHAEVKLTPTGPVVLEMNPRVAGDCIVDLIDLAVGVNLYELVGREALGETLLREQLEPRRRAAAAIHFRPAEEGVFAGASSPLEASPPDWLVELSVTAEPGQRLSAPSSNGDRIAYAIATAPSEPQARARAAEAVATLEVRVDAPAETPRPYVSALR